MDSSGRVVSRVQSPMCKVKVKRPSAHLKPLKWSGVEDPWRTDVFQLLAECHHEVPLSLIFSGYHV